MKFLRCAICSVCVQIFYSILCTVASERSKWWKEILHVAWSVQKWFHFWYVFKSLQIFAQIGMLGNQWWIQFLKPLESIVHSEISNGDIVASQKWFTAKEFRKLLELGILGSNNFGLFLILKKSIGKIKEYPFYLIFLRLTKFFMTTLGMINAILMSLAVSINMSIWPACFSLPP